MLHDEEVYPNPGAFMPERFIQDKVINTKLRDPRELIFGFGRR
jgi:cytochrome P450